MRVLITGGAGFIGSHLCDFLLDQGCRVICLDNLLTSNIANIQHLVSNDDFQFVKHDIAEPLSTDFDIDYVFHLASPASPLDFQKLPIEILRAGSLGTFNALEIAREKKAR